MHFDLRKFLGLQYHVKREISVCSTVVLTVSEFVFLWFMVQDAESQLQILKI